MTKKCPKCEQVKDLSEYYPHPQGTLKLKVSSWCKECMRARQRKYGAVNKEKISEANRARRNTPEGKRKQRDRGYKRHYGVGIDYVEALIKSQGDKCAVCKEDVELGKHTHLDHAHSTGEIRGVLCSNCNHLLGKAKDSVAILESAIAYLALREGN